MNIQNYQRGMVSNEGSVLVADDLDKAQSKEQGTLEKNQNSVMATAKNILVGNNEISQIYGETTAQTSYFDSKLVSKRGQSESRQRAVTRSPKSRYRSIPTKNIKFEKFIELIFKSRMQT